MSETKTCTKCGEVKEFDAFRVKPKRDGRASHRPNTCRACESAAVQAARPAQGVPVETKTCDTCLRVKPATAFKVPRGVHANGETCLLADCRACRNAKSARVAAPVPPPLPTADQLAAIHRAGRR